jgi:catechol 2,3-dioxygenase-like lactoylglutathione lyase family enzyme
VVRGEAVVLPVADVDRAKAFYQGLGSRLDADFVTGLDFRVVQMTPPGSACAVIFGTGITTAAPGSADELDARVTGRRTRRQFGTRGAPVPAA